MSISSDGDLQIANDRAGGAAAVGDVRFAKEWSVYAKNDAGTADLCVATSYADAFGDLLLLGSDGEPNNAGTYAAVLASAISSVASVVQGVGASGGLPVAGVVAYENLPNAAAGVGVVAFPNLIVTGQASLTPPVDPAAGGMAIVALESSATPPAYSVPGFVQIWFDGSDIKVRLPSGLVKTVVLV